MTLTDKVKNLISDGKTQQALDLLQEFLKDRDAELLNQSYLLESQYKDLEKKMQLGLQDAASELNRVNFSLLNMCDEAEKLENSGETPVKKEGNTEGSLFNDGSLKNPLLIFGVLIGVALLIIVGIVALKGCGSDKVVAPLPTQPVVTTPLVAPKSWHAMPEVLNVNDRLYGNFKIQISKTETETFDENANYLKLNLQLNCLKSYSGKCISSYLRYELSLPTGEKILIEDLDTVPESPSDGSATTVSLAFKIPKNVQAAELKVFYVEKPQSLASVKLAVNN